MADDGETWREADVEVRSVGKDTAREAIESVLGILERMGIEPTVPLVHDVRDLATGETYRPEQLEFDFAGTS